MRGNVVLGVLLMLSPLVTVAAEEEASVVPGDRVRLLAPSVSTKRVTGQITAIDADTLEVRAEPSRWFSDANEAFGTLRISLDSLTRLEVSQGTGGDVLWGGIRGFAVGAGVVCLLSVTDMLGAGREYELALLRIAPITLTVGAVSGALLSSRRERWEEVHLGRIQTGIAAERRGGIMLSASATF